MTHEWRDGLRTLALIIVVFGVFGITAAVVQQFDLVEKVKTQLRRKVLRGIPLCLLMVSLLWGLFCAVFFYCPAFPDALPAPREGDAIVLGKMAGLVWLAAMPALLHYVYQRDYDHEPPDFAKFLVVNTLGAGFLNLCCGIVIMLVLRAIGWIK